MSGICTMSSNPMYLLLHSPLQPESLTEQDKNTSFSIDKIPFLVRNKMSTSTQAKILSIKYNLVSCFQILHFRFISAKCASHKIYGEIGSLCQLTGKRKARLLKQPSRAARKTTTQVLSQHSTNSKVELTKR